MNWREFGKQSADPLGHREDGHYFMSSEEEVAMRNNKMELDSTVLERKKREYFEKYANDNLNELYNKVCEMGEALFPAHDEAKFRVLLRMDQGVFDVQEVYFKQWRLKDLEGRKRYGRNCLDTLLEAMVKIGY